MPKRNFKPFIIKAILLTLMTLLMGFGYDYAKPRTYGPDHLAGFHTGILHGMLMPMAFPTLVGGENAPLFAAKNEGRSYKIGFILGINTCGTIFFGIGFWPTKRRNRVPRA